MMTQNFRASGRPDFEISPDSSIILKICQSAAHACNDEYSCSERAVGLTSWMRRSVDMQIEGQLTPVATLVVHLLAFAVPIRARRVELGACESPAD